MTQLGSVARLHAGRALSRLAQGFGTFTGQTSTRQWMIAGAIGVALGITTLAVMAFPSRWAPLIVLAVLCPFVAMIVGVRRLLLAIIVLDIPLQLDTNLGYREDVASLGALGGLNISLTTVSLIILYALWLAGALARREPQPRIRFRDSLPLAFYLAFVALSIAAARDVTLSLYQFALLLQMFLLYVYVASTVQTRRDVLFLVTLLLVSLVLESLIMIASQSLGPGFQIPGIKIRLDAGDGIAQQSYRVGGTVGSPNTAAGFLSLLLMPALGLLLTWFERRHKLLGLLAFGLAIVALTLTFSRGGWTAFVLSLVILCVLAWFRGWLAPRILLAVILAAVLVSTLFSDAVSARLFGEDSGSARSRIPLMNLAYRVIGDQPVLGVGANNYAIRIKDYATPEFNGEWLYSVHNKYLLIWAETGIGALLTFIWFLAVTVRRGWRSVRSGERYLSPLALGLTAAIIGHVSQMFVEAFNGRPLMQLLWLMAGLVTAMSYIGNDQAKRVGRAG